MDGGSVVLVRVFCSQIMMIMVTVQPASNSGGWDEMATSYVSFDVLFTYTRDLTVTSCR